MTNNKIDYPIIKTIKNSNLTNLSLHETFNASRFGSVHDGGYILTDEIVLSSKFLISGGVGLNVEFENDILQLNNSIKIILIDGSISFLKFLFRPLKHLFTSSFYFYCENSFRFFNIKSKSSFEKTFLDKSKNISFFLKKYDLFNSKGILKLDIEGNEWSLLNDVINNCSNFNAICIEFHFINTHIEILNEFIHKLKNKNFQILSYSVNNAIHFNYEKELPEIIEITFAQNIFLNEKKILQRRSNDDSNIIYNF